MKEWIGFRLEAQKAASANGFHRTVAAQFAAAFGELQSNVYEHSGAPQTGLIVFKVSDGLFEFVVADWGVGVLRSLQSCVEFATVDNHAQALELTLTDGVSRYGSSARRGHGFRPLFTGLANLNGTLRFRSGDHALTVEGDNFGAIPWKLAQKIPIKGFVASISCRIR
jgi:hypothetical protein